MHAHTLTCALHIRTRASRFFFALTGAQPGVPYKFNLVNFRKKQSLFATGMQPLVCCCSHSGAGFGGSHAGSSAAGHDTQGRLSKDSGWAWEMGATGAAAACAAPRLQAAVFPRRTLGSCIMWKVQRMTLVMWKVQRMACRQLCS